MSVEKSREITVNGVTISTEHHDMLVTSTSTHTEVVIVNAVMTVQCCENQQGWKRGYRLWPFDTSGLGEWVTAGMMPCGGCGSLVSPPSVMLTEPTQGEIDEAITRVSYETQDLMILEAHKIFNGLTDDLMAVIDEAGDLMDIVNASNVIELENAQIAKDWAQEYATGSDTEPGVFWEDGRGWIVWGIDKYGREYVGVYRVHGDGTIAWTMTEGERDG